MPVRQRCIMCAGLCLAAAATVVVCLMGYTFVRWNMTPRFSAKDLVGTWADGHPGDRLVLRADHSYVASGPYMYDMGFKNGNWVIVPDLSPGVSLTTGPKSRDQVFAENGTWDLTLWVCLDGAPERATKCTTLHRTGP